MNKIILITLIIIGIIVVSGIGYIAYENNIDDSLGIGLNITEQTVRLGTGESSGTTSPKQPSQ